MTKLSANAILEVMALVGILVSFAIALFFYGQLPDTIAVHFGVYGQPDGWGPKAIIWIMPGMSLWTYLLMTFSAKIKRGNDPKSLAKAKAAEPLLLWLKFELAWLLTYIEAIMIAVPLRKASGLGVWFLPVYLVVILGTIAIFIFKIFKAMKDANTKPTNEK